MAAGVWEKSFWRGWVPVDVAEGATCGGLSPTLSSQASRHLRGAWLLRLSRTSSQTSRSFFLTVR